MDTKKRTNQPTNLTIFLGRDPDEIKRRKEALDKLAKAYNVKRSTLIQRIADGELEVVPPSPRRAS